MAPELTGSAEDSWTLAQAFADAVAAPGERARLIEPNGRAGAWVSIATAVNSGKPYMVNPCRGVLAVDLDDAEDHRWAEHVRAKLAPLGCHFVRTDSGTPGHGHLWIVPPAGWSTEYTRATALKRAGDHAKSQIRFGQMTRPPYAPHRSRPVRATVVEPEPLEALAIFRTAQPTNLPDDTWHLLKTAKASDLRRTRHGVPSRGITLHAIACSAVAHRWERGQLEHAIREVGDSLVASKWREQANPSDFLSRAYDEAQSFIREHPPAALAASRRAQIARLRTAMSRTDWPARTGASDRAVYAALLACADAGATLTPTASQRQLSDATGLGRAAVAGALARLQGRGLIQRQAAAERTKAIGYSLPVGAAVVGEVFAHPAISDSGGPKSLVVGTAATLGDIFTNGSGLGLSCRETWEALPPAGSPITVAQLRKARPGALSAPTVRAHLRELESVGFARREGRKWWQVVPDDAALELIAAALGVKNKRANRRAYYARERLAFGGTAPPGGSPGSPAGGSARPLPSAS